MSARRDRLDEALRALGDGAPPPPPSAALEAIVRAGRPVRTRAPLKTLSAIVVLSLAIVAVHVLVYKVRRDLADLPQLWFFSIALVWCAAFVLPLAVALLPRRRTMLADSSRAAILAFLVPALALAIGLFLRVDVPPHTYMPKPNEELRYVFTCMLSGLEMAAAPFAAAALALRAGATPVSARWLGAALGASAGALGGFMLHVHCPIGGLIHVTFGHGGGALVGALLGVVLGPAIARRR